MICSFCGNVTENVWAYRRLAELENRLFFDCPDCSAPLTLTELRAAVENYAEHRGNGQNYIKGKDGKFEGSRPGSGSGSASGAGKGIDKSQKSGIMASDKQIREFKNQLLGTKTATGVVIKDIYDHCADRMIQRKITPNMVKDTLINPGATYPGNVKNRTCCQKGKLRVVFENTGVIVTAIDLD